MFSILATLQNVLSIYCIVLIAYILSSDNYFLNSKCVLLLIDIHGKEAEGRRIDAFEDSWDSLGLQGDPSSQF